MGRWGRLIGGWTDRIGYRLGEKLSVGSLDIADLDRITIFYVSEACLGLVADCNRSGSINLKHFHNHYDDTNLAACVTVLRSLLWSMNGHETLRHIHALDLAGECHRLRRRGLGSLRARSRPNRQRNGKDG